jgi:hypothetical protein
MGRMGGDRRQTNEWEGETEKDAFSKKSCYIQKMKTNNVWGKKRSATVCSTKQNIMGFCRADNNPQKAAAGAAKMATMAVVGAEAAVAIVDVVFHMCQAKNREMEGGCCG